MHEDDFWSLRYSFLIIFQHEIFRISLKESMPFLIMPISLRESLIISRNEDTIVYDEGLLHN
jgi:hypothetical protein